MSKFKMVREYEVVLPEKDTKNWRRLEDWIRNDMDPEDAAIVLASDEAIATWVFWHVSFDGEIPEPFDSAVHGEYDPKKYVHKVIASCFETVAEVTKIED